MKRTKYMRIAVFLLAIVISMSLSATAATAVGDPAPASPSPDQAVEDFKAEIVSLVNAEREKAGVAALTVLDTLTAPADVRAKESCVQFKHTRPDGTKCFTVFGEYELKYRAAGENLAYGFSTPENVMRAWMNSPTHKSNILDADFKYIGIGYYVNDSGRVYVSQLFYTPYYSN